MKISKNVKNRVMQTMHAALERTDGVEKQASQIMQNIAGSRQDEKPAAWITTETGAHIPLDEEGKALGGAGGALKGKDMSNAKSSKSGKTSSKAFKPPKAPKYWNSMFATKVINAMESGELTDKNISEWDTKYNGGVKPNPPLNTREIMDHYKKLKENGYEDDTIKAAAEYRNGKDNKSSASESKPSASESKSSGSEYTMSDYRKHPWGEDLDADRKFTKEILESGDDYVRSELIDDTVESMFAYSEPDEDSVRETVKEFKEAGAYEDFKASFEKMFDEDFEESYKDVLSKSEKKSDKPTEDEPKTSEPKTSKPKSNSKKSSSKAPKIDKRISNVDFYFSDWQGGNRKKLSQKEVMNMLSESQINEGIDARFNDPYEAVEYMANGGRIEFVRK